MASVLHLSMGPGDKQFLSGMGWGERLEWLDDTVLNISPCLYSTPDCISPLLQRRSVTSYGEFPSIPHVRSRSARYPSANLTMSRSHVSVARFYDWSEDLGDCVSVSRLYRDLANLPRAGDRGKSKNMQWCSNGIRVTPGRMFSREKGALTKGEREIIEGIYRNRGEHARDTNRHDSPIRSHHEAWLVGRTIAKGAAKQEQKNSAPKQNDDSEFRVPDSLFVKSNSSTDEVQLISKDSCNSCYFCAKERNGLKHGKSDATHSEVIPHCKDNGDWYDEGPVAPPSTPDKLLQKRARAQGHNSSDPYFTFPDSPESSHLDSPRKVRVNVYLPAVAAEQSEDDIKSCLLHGQSLLRKERPLSQSDFKRQQERGSQRSPPSRTPTPRERLSRVSTSPRPGSTGGDKSVLGDNIQDRSVPFGFELSE